MILSDADYELLERIKGGEQWFQPSSGSQRARDAFAGVVARLYDLRDRGLIEVSRSGATRTKHGEYLVIGPCELTAEGRTALERH